MGAILKRRSLSFFATVLALVLSCTSLKGQQGKVIINEINSDAGCIQFVELKNLGPGRQNIGCYKLVNQKYAITIPPGIVLNPGDIYLIAGANTITCGGAVNRTVNLNWSSCNLCTSTTLTQDQFFDDWKNDKSYPLVLYNSSNSIVDAIRTPGNNLASPNAITTTLSTNSGSSCATTTLTVPTDINVATTVYESINPKTGNNGTLSRSGDGSCDWFKATAADRTPGLANQTETGTAVVGATSTYTLSCNTAASSYTSTLTVTATSIPFWYQFVFFPNSDLSQGTTATSTTVTNTQNIITQNPAAGLYSYLFAPSADRSCGETPFIVQVIDPIMTVSPTYSVDCLGGIASLKVTNVGATNVNAPYYFPISYNLTSSTSTYTSSGTATTPDVVRIGSIPVGTYTATLTPASQYACPKAVGFSISTAPLSPLSATVTTTATCQADVAAGTASIKLTNANPGIYYPIGYSLYKLTTGAYSLVETGTFNAQADASLITKTGLFSGTYSITLDPEVDGCVTNSTFTITVGNTACTVQEILKSFSAKKSGVFIDFDCKLDAGGILNTIYLESSYDGKNFRRNTNVPFENRKGIQDIQIRIPASQDIFYRLEITDTYTKKFISPILKVNQEPTAAGMQVYPNPFKDQLDINITALQDDILILCIMSSSGMVLEDHHYPIKKGQNSISLNTKRLPKGSYFLCTQKVSKGTREVSQIIKQ